MTVNAAPITSVFTPGFRLIDGSDLNALVALINAGFAGQLLTAQVTLTSAQLLALHTTPISIIPAPAAGQLVVVESVTYKGTGAYTNAGGSGLVYHGTSVAADESFSAPANPWVNGTVLSGRVPTNVNMTTALSLGVDISGVAADPTVGTTPATVTVRYYLMTP